MRGLRQARNAAAPSGALRGLVYYNPTIHSASDTGATDYIWEPNKFYAYFSESFAFGRIDGNGYNNSYPHEQGRGVDVLVMGSSHMEAFQVPQDKNATYLLNKYLEDGGYDYFAYNISISGHDFLRCASNLKSALSTFKPTKYVVIETDSVCFEPSGIADVLAGAYPEISSHDKGIIGFLQRFPYLRLMYHQLMSLAGQNGDNTVPGSGEVKEDAQPPSYRDSFIKLIRETAETAADSSVKLIIIYHPRVSFDGDGSMLIDTRADYLELFETACGENGVVFVDMSERFLAEYQNGNAVPYGFTNTIAGDGHLNKDVNRMAADMLYDVIIQNETEENR